MNEAWQQSQTVQRLHNKLAGELSKLALAHQFTALLGPRHSGKTHVLHAAVQSVATHNGWSAILLSLHELQGSACTTEEFFGEVLTQLQEKLFVCHPALATDERFKSGDERINSARFRDRVNSMVREIGGDLFIVFDHLETLPEFFASELLQALRTFAAEPKGIPRVVAGVASTLSITSLNTGVVSPYFNIARELHIGDLSEQDNQDIARELLSHTDEDFRAELLRNARGDLDLLRWICAACIENANEKERPVPDLRDLKEAVADFIAHEAKRHPVFEEAQKRIATSPGLLSCMADLTGERKNCKPDLKTGTALWLTGLVARNAEGSYSLRNEIYHKYLQKYYTPERLGRLLAATGVWEQGTDLLAKHYSASPDTDDEQPMLDFAITAAFVAGSLEEAVSRLTRVLETAFPVRNPQFWLQSVNGATLRCIRCAEESAPSHSDIPKNDPGPEARAWRTSNVLTSGTGDQVAFPLVTHSNKCIGVVKLHQWRKMMQSSDRPRRIDDLRDFLNKAARPLDQLIKREQQQAEREQQEAELARERELQEAERALREQQMPDLIALISRLANVKTLPNDALGHLSAARVLPFRGAVIQLLNTERSHLEVSAFTGKPGDAEPKQVFPVPSRRGKIGVGYLNVRVWRQGEPRRWQSREKTPFYAKSPGYFSWKVTAWMGIPLKANEKTLGVLTFYNDQAGPGYSEKHITVARQIADSIAARIYEARQAERLRQERDLLRRITASMQNLDKTWTNILEGAMKLTGAEAGNIGLVDPIRNQITIPAALVKSRQGDMEPLKTDQLGAYRFSTDLMATKSIMSWVTVNRRPVNIGNVKKDKPWNSIYETLHNNTLSEIAVPIFNPGTEEVVGIINLESPRPHAFGREDLALLQEMTPHVYFAVNNAQLYERLRAESLRSAVTAIMARNMSHNIGSHSLSYLSSKGTLILLTDADARPIQRSTANMSRGNDAPPVDEAPQLAEQQQRQRRLAELTSNLNGYIRERMDFIASIPSLDPTWTMPLDVIEAIFDPVWGPGEDCAAPRLFLLLNTIARSERIYAPALRLHVRLRDDRQPEVEETFTYGYEFEADRFTYKRSPAGGTSSMARKIAVFMGTTGLQAMYGLMENFIRNSAKHSDEIRLEGVRSQNAPNAKTANPAKALHVTMEFTYNYDAGRSHAPGDLVRLRMYDNMGGWKTDEVGAKINAGLDSFLDEKGSLVEGGWGLKEMRICASFLRGLMISQYEAVHDPPVLRAEPCRMEDNRRSLGYVLYLPRVKECLLLGPAASLGLETLANNEWANQGVYTADKLEKLEEWKRRGSFNHAAILIALENPRSGQEPGGPSADGDFVGDFLRHPTHYPAKTLLAAPDAAILERVRQAHPMLQDRESIVCCFDAERILRAVAPLPPPQDAAQTAAEAQIVTHEATQAAAEAATRTDATHRITVNADTITAQAAQSFADAWQSFTRGERAILQIKTAWLQQQMGLTTFPPLQIIFENFVDSTSDAWANLLVERPAELAGALVFDHGWRGLRGHPELLPACRFYAPYRSAPSTALNRLLLAMSRSGAYDFERFSAYLELLEAALTNVIVMDERIFGDSLTRRHFQGEADVLLNRCLALQNIAVFNILPKNKKNTMAGVARSEALLGKKGPTDVPRPIEFSLSNLEASLREYVPDHFASQVHFLILHHTILEKKLGGLKKLPAFLNALGAYRPRWLVITSGAGRPEAETMPSEARFLEYSNLRRFTIQDVDKILLSRMLWSLKDG